MAEIFEFEGVVRNIRYSPHLRAPLKTFPLAEFDVNMRAGSAIIIMDADGSTLGFSKWKSPKRTRTYPFARIYNTYHLPKRVTVIPVFKDEGINGDNDRINFITFSWMNLMNVYIILAWYDTARKNSRRDGKIAEQHFDNHYVHEKLLEIYHYQQTALHWNIMHFERDFASIHRRAVESYERISSATGVAIHSPQLQLKALEAYLSGGVFDRTLFQAATLERSRDAANREIRTQHRLELLEDGVKGLFFITNYLGGEYHLTADEILKRDDTIIIQESKNASKGKLPSLSDIQDGLLKLILFTNMDELRLGGKRVTFSTQLKLTGNLKGMLRLPADSDTILTFGRNNMFTPKQINLLSLLNHEAAANPPLQIVLGSKSYD